MLLQELRRYAETRGLVEESYPFYAARPVRYVIDLDRDGRPTSRVPADRAERGAKGRAVRGKEHLTPSIQRTSATKPLLLCDAPEYLFGRVNEQELAKRAKARRKAMPRDIATDLEKDWLEKNKEELEKDRKELVDRAAKRREAMASLIRACASDTGDGDVLACLAFLDGDASGWIDWPKGFADGDTLTFTVGGRMVIDRPAVRAWWAARCDPGARVGKGAPGGAGAMACLVCGEVGPVLDRLPEKLKGVPKGRAEGIALIAADETPFWSYGLKISRVAPTCARCAQAFTLGANHLLADRRATYRIQDVAAYSFWTRDVVAFDPMALLQEPEAADATAMLAAVERGGSMPEIDETRFFGLSLAGSGGRAAVRDWLETSVGDVRRAMAAWFQDMQVVGHHGGPARRFGIWHLAATTVRDAKKELTPHVLRSLLGAAVAGRPFPLDLLVRAVRRLHAVRRLRAQDDFPFWADRAALIALCLRRHPSGAYRRDLEAPMLNENHPSAAYQCGRLLYVLEAAQRLALPGVEATIVDRFYGTASTAPLSVFGRLMRGAQAHLGKLERDKPGAHWRLQGRIEAIASRLDGFPAALPLVDQGLFALGYYHQRAHDHAEAAAAAERRRADAPSDGEAADASDADAEPPVDPPVQARLI